MARRVRRIASECEGAGLAVVAGHRYSCPQPRTILCLLAHGKMALQWESHSATVCRIVTVVLGRGHPFINSCEQQEAEIPSVGSVFRIRSWDSEPFPLPWA